LTDVPTSFTASAHTHTESDITWTNHTLFPIGDDIYIGDVNLGGHLGLKSKKATYNTGLIFIKQNTDDDTTPSTTGGKITWDGTKFSITSTAAIDGTITNSTWTTLLKPIASTTTASASTWNIPSGSKQVWGERFSDSELKYTDNGTQKTVTDTGDWTMWLTSGGTTNTATFNMRIDGTYYGSFSGNLSGTADKANKDGSGNTITNKYF